MSPRPRQTRTGTFKRSARPASQTTFATFRPIEGWSSEPQEVAAPSSLVSGQNVWIQSGRLVPRLRLAQLGSNIPTPDIINGAFIYDDISGGRFPVVTSKGTVAYLESLDSWTTLNYASGTSDSPPSGGENDSFFGTSVYLPRRDLNLAVFANGVDPLFAWAGPSDSTAFSTLTQGPIASDVALFDNSVIAWNIRELSSSSRFVQRVQWSAAGNPENWTDTNAGAGFEDLVDMRGRGTRIFTDEQQIIVATGEEIWRGVRRGDFFRFSFAALTKNIGIPFPRAAIQTPAGIFWLNRDFMVYQLASNQIQPVGQSILEELRDTLTDFDKAFFGYDEIRQQVTLYYTATAGSYPQRAFTLHTQENGFPWAPQRYAQNLTTSLLANTASSSTTWGGLIGSIGSQTFSWEQLLGRSTTRMEVLTTSRGTALNRDSRASLDAGQVVTAQYVSGGLFTGDPTTIKFVDEVRLDLRGDSVSSVTVQMSANFGGAFIKTKQVAVSATSNTSQQRVPLTLSGQYLSLGLQSDDTGWELGRVGVRARVVGQKT